MTFVHHLIGKASQFDRVDSRQVKNHDGAFVFPVDCFTSLERFLILGSAGGTYYATERQVTRDSAQIVQECLAKDPLRTVKLIVDISQWGRAPKQSAGILALAIASASPDPYTRAIALPALPLVCRTGSTLMEFVANVSALRGWGSGLRRTLADWYTRLSPDELAYQTLKYRRRNGWSHRDILRKAHVPHAPLAPKSQAMMRWIVGGRPALDWRVLHSVKDQIVQSRREQPLVGEPPALVSAFERIQALPPDTIGTRAAIELITEFRMPHEMVPDHFKKNPAIWEALAAHMPPHALIRNLGKLSAIGLVTPGSQAAAAITTRLSRLDVIRKSRVHPMAFFVAHAVYAQGHGEKGKLTWTPADEVTQALEQSFYLAFGNVEPSNARLWICLDVSDSMNSGLCASIPGMSPKRIAAALALLALKTEPNAVLMAFTERLVPLDIHSDWSIGRVDNAMRGLPFGATDCSLPFRHARELGASVDGFAVYTDSETNRHTEHPFVALKKYREVSGIMARLAVVAMTTNEFSIAEPSDGGMLDVVGCDAHTPALLADFFRGKRVARTHDSPTEH